MSSLPRAPSFRVDGRRALVTGAGRGIGLAAAAALAQAGADVTLVSRSDDELRHACEAIRADGGRCTHAVLDVTDAAAVDRTFAQHAPFQILVNNAGMNRLKPLVEAYRAAGLDVTLKIYPGGRHEMLNETNREEVVRDLLAWLEAHA